MRKRSLYVRICKFYNIFGEVVGDNFINNIFDMTSDNAHDVLFDIEEVLNGYGFAETDSMYKWLTKLHNDISDFCEKSTVRFNRWLIIFIIGLVFIMGAEVGRSIAIHQAELVEITNAEYLIDFNGETHEYEFDTSNLVEIEDVEGGNN